MRASFLRLLSFRFNGTRSSLESRGLCEVHLSRRMEQDFESRDHAVQAPAIDKLATASAHRLAFAGILHQVLDGQPNRLCGDVFVPAKASGGTFLFQPLGGWPMRFVLHDQQLRHTHTGELQREAPLRAYGEVAAGDSRGDVRPLAGERQAIFMGGGEFLKRNQVRVLRTHDHVDAFDLRHCQELLGQFEGLAMRIVVAQGNQGPNGGRLFLRRAGRARRISGRTMA